MSRYGQYDISGVKDADGDPFPRTWDPLRQCWSDDWKSFIYESEWKELDQRYKSMRYRVADKCPDPKTLMDIVETAKKDPLLATNAIAEILEQLKYQDKYHVLTTLDGFNSWLQPSGYDSFRYVNNGSTKGKIVPNDLALVRLLLRFDGQFMRQGVKFLATTHYKHHNHVMTPEHIDWFDGYSHEVPRLTLNEFRNMLTYKNLSEWMPAYYREWEIERLYMETQGNYGAFHDTYFKYDNAWMTSKR